MPYNVKTVYTYFLLVMTMFITHPIDAQKFQNNNRVKNLERYDNQTYHFGFMLGFNQMNFSISQNANYRSIDSLYVVEAHPQKGFNVGIVSNLRITHALDLRFIPSLYFGERSLYYSYKDKGELIQEVKNVESNMLSFPLLVKYKSARLTNSRVYVIAGAQYTLDLAAQSKKKEIFNEENAIKLYPNDLMFEAGVGFDFYLVYFKFATELKFCYGTRDVLKKEANLYTGSINKLNSHLLVLSFTFE